jgi:hypothetical protein
VVLALGDHENFPVRVAVHPSETFRELAQRCEKSIQAAHAHRLFAVPAMLSLRGMPASRVSHPVFSVAYLEGAATSGAEERLRFPSSVYGGLDLILAASPGLTLRFIYSSGLRGADAIEKLCLTLSHVLKTATNDPETGIYQLGANSRSAKSVLSSEHAPQFAF